MKHQIHNKTQFSFSNPHLSQNQMHVFEFPTQLLVKLFNGQIYRTKIRKYLFLKLHVPKLKTSPKKQQTKREMAKIAQLNQKI